ncbi:MAG: GIY-YIG nuclease family protein [Taibaiella sp.]|nr:GIY-YIG nuclease family protein [Taibaiella sp.]
MASVYILYSPSLDKYYVGATSLTLAERLERHLAHFYGQKFTSVAADWSEFFQIDCNSMTQALKIEKHIKRMKSRKFIENLKNHPEVVSKLLEKYTGQ